MVNPLSSWNENGTKQAILNFIGAVTDPASASFVPPAERIATFDNDGTLWLEKPLYIQVLHGLHVIGKLAAEKPELRERQPFKAVYEKDMAWLGKVAADFARGDLNGIITLLSGYAEAFDGANAELFDADAREFLNNAQDARFKKPYKLLTYQPMVELVRTLQDKGFQVYITTGAKNPDTKDQPIEALRLPVGSPNVLNVLIDDTSFDTSSTFGSPVHMPIAERMAAYLESA